MFVRDSSIPFCRGECVIVQPGSTPGAALGRREASSKAGLLHAARSAFGSEQLLRLLGDGRGSCGMTRDERAVQATLAKNVETLLRLL